MAQDFPCGTQTHLSMVTLRPKQGVPAETISLHVISAKIAPMRNRTRVECFAVERSIHYAIPGTGQQIEAVPKSGAWHANERGQAAAASGAHAAFTAPTRYGYNRNSILSNQDFPCGTNLSRGALTIHTEALTLFE